MLFELIDMFSLICDGLLELSFTRIKIPFLDSYLGKYSLPYRDGHSRPYTDVAAVQFASPIPFKAASFTG
jgi:hypothetical protein